MRNVFAQILRPPNIFYLVDTFEELVLLCGAFGPRHRGILLPRIKPHVTFHQLKVIPRKILANVAIKTKTKQTNKMEEVVKTTNTVKEM